MSCVIPDRLYVGGIWNATNLTELINSRIGYMISMASEHQYNRAAASIVFKHLPLEDQDDEFALPTFVDAIRYIQKISSTDAILVHCRMGKSRSVSAVIAYLMATMKMPFNDAFSLVKEKRSCAQPNTGYVHQLIALAILLQALQYKIHIIHMITELL